MNPNTIVSIESTNEMPTNSIFKHPFQKITTANGNIYSWNSSMNVGTNWTSIRLCEEGIQNQPDSQDSPYNIQIIHNFEHKPMINVNKGNQQGLRQEINRWELRNSGGWHKDEVVEPIQ